MNRMDKIRDKRIQVASDAAASFRQFLNKDFGTIKKEQLQRTRLFKGREANRPEADFIVAATERVIGARNESTTKPPSVEVQKTGSPVARIQDMFAATEPKGFATGFLIAPNILITNQHVFETAADAQGCVANFNHQDDYITGKLNEGPRFKLSPDKFFYCYPALDFALVYVEDEALEGNASLAGIGLLPMIATKGKIAIGSPINIIQYPQGGVKKYTTQENKVTTIDDEQGVVYYNTDTEPGSSGSPGFNEFWEVAVLHNTGVPETNSNGDWITTKGGIWDKHTMDDNDVHWLSNAGKSISHIVAFLKTLQLESTPQSFIDRVLNNTGDPLKTNESTPREILPAIPIPATTIPSNTFKPDTMSQFTFNFNAAANIYINSAAPTANITETKNVATNKEGAIEKKERFDENYDDRKGYDPDFLKGFRVPFPSVKKQRAGELYKNFGASVPYIVPYHHYSLVMNKRRRMVMWTASNVDYNPDFRDNRERADFGSGAWRLDKRIPAKYQIQAGEFYDPATLVDKGHIVRRDDNCWAPLKNNQSDSIGIEYANADTFHWTNCTPQHEAFNRDMAQYAHIGKWGVLENAVKAQLDDTEDANKDYGQRACVLAGPILADDDPEFMDIKYPLQFWKVFAINSATAGKLVYGFILSQADKVEAAGIVKPTEGRPRFEVMVKAMQKSLAQIEALSGVVFDKSLHAADVLKGQEPTESLHDDLSNFRRGRK